MHGSTVLAPPPALADLVEAIWQVDVPDGDAAQALSVRLLPTAASVMVVHYRAPIRSDRRNYEQRPYRSIVTGVQRETVTLAPGGPTGSIVVRFRPGAAARLCGNAMQNFTDANVELDDIVGAGARASLQDELNAAAGAAARLAILERFLLPRARHQGDPLVTEVVGRLRRTPGQPVGRVARVAGVSQRQLERRFMTDVGVTPKQFARMVRLEKVIAARHRGNAWAEIAVDCGFTDQAHLVRDFKASSGMTPEGFMRQAFVGPHAEANRALALSGFYNTAII